MRSWFLPAAFATVSIALAACGGGGSGSSGFTPPANGQRQLTVAFTGTTTLSIHPMAVSGTAVTVTLNGKAVGSGTLDSTGKATLKISDDIPPGSTLVITAGSISASFVWNQTANDASVLITVNSAAGTITVTVASGEQPEASPDPNDPNGQEATETNNGSPTGVDENQNESALPANLPITVSRTCATITITPTDSRIASIRFEENLQDGDGGSKFKFQGAFTSAMTFPLISASARIRIELFDASGKQLLEVRAPISAFTPQAGQPTPAPCPSTTPTVAPSALPTTSPTDSPEPQPTHTP